MKTPNLLLSLLLFMISGAASAAPRTVVLDVQNMTCPVCPLTVKKALEGVPGVQRVSVDYPGRTATVQFDDAAAVADKLTEATRAVGYPSTLKGEGR